PTGAGWGGSGVTGSGAPPAPLALLPQSCVGRRGGRDAPDSEDATPACTLLPGPASTQLAIFCAWRLRGRPGALVGGACFIVPGLVLILALAALFLEGSPPRWVVGAGAGAGAAVAAVAVSAGWSLLPDSWRRTASRGRWLASLAAGAASAATVGPWLVLVLVGCGVLELAIRQSRRAPRSASALTPPLAVAAAGGTGGMLALAWVALKVGALSYGG